MPIQRRLPKRGFRSAMAGQTADVRLQELSKISDAVIDLAALKKANMVSPQAERAKIYLSGTLEKAVTLSVVPGIRPKQARFNYFPKREFSNVSQRLANGDLIYFVSTRRDLDVYHVGMIFRVGGKLIVRHARLQRGSVVEQPLADFVKVIQAPGFIIYRPAENSTKPMPAN